MHTITMPQSGQTMEEGTIIAWLKAEGDAIGKGEVIAEIETDKAVFEFESPEGGTILKLLQPEGAIVPVHTAIALVGAAGEDVEAYLTANPVVTPTRAGAPDAREAGEAKAASEEATSPVVEAGGAAVSPAARKAARELGVDLAKISKGSGPGGRITYDDVVKASGSGSEVGAAAAPAAGGAQGPARRPMTKMRRAIAANLALSKQTIPHFYARLTVDAEPMLSFHEAKKAECACSLNDVIILACARAMKEFAEFRSRVEGTDAVETASANIGIAVATNDGLLVPVVEGADGMKLTQLAAETRRVVSAARGGRLEGAGKGTFTVTNLGMYGVEEFAAIINPPEAAILAIGAVREAAVVKAGAVKAGRVMTMTLSSDHRVIDGVAAARFLARLKGLLEHPETI
jgi:pyruvate dehydrogenase E2 component (dihydrolipoamide acetyltransferase)